MLSPCHTRLGRRAQKDSRTCKPLLAAALAVVPVAGAFPRTLRILVSVVVGDGSVDKRVVIRTHSLRTVGPHEIAVAAAPVVESARAVTVAQVRTLRATRAWQEHTRTSQHAPDQPTPRIRRHRGAHKHGNRCLSGEREYVETTFCKTSFSRAPAKRRGKWPLTPITRNVRYGL